MQYRSTRGLEEFSFSQALSLGRAPDGGYFVPAELPQFDWQNFLQSEGDSRVLSLVNLFCPELELDQQVEVLATAFNADAYPDGIYRAACLNKYANNRFILELDRGPSGFLHDHGLALHLACYKVLGIGQDRYCLVGPFAEEHRAYDAWRGLQNRDEMRPAIFIQPETGNELKYVNRHELDRYYKVQANRFDLENALRDLPVELAGRLDYLDSSSPAYLLSSMIILALGLADLFAQEELPQGIDLALPMFSLNWLLAAIYLKSMGIPIRQILLVNGQNHGVTDFIRTGRISLKRRYIKSKLADLERLIPSNFESLIFELSGRNLDLTSSFFAQLKEKKQARVDRGLVKNWSNQLISCYATERRVDKLQADFYHETDYLADPYTLICLAGIEHTKSLRQAKLVFPLCGRPWKGSDQDRADLVRELSAESGCMIQSYFSQTREGVEPSRIDIADLTGSIEQDLLEFGLSQQDQAIEEYLEQDNKLD